MAKPTRAAFLAQLRFLRSRRCHTGLRGCEGLFLTWSRIEPGNRDETPPFHMDKEARESLHILDDTIECRWTGNTRERICQECNTTETKDPDNGTLCTECTKVQVCKEHQQREN